MLVSVFLYFSLIKNIIQILLFILNVILLLSKPMTLLQILINYRVLSKLRFLWPNSIIRSLLMCDVSSHLILKQIIKVFVKAQLFKTTWPSKKLSEKYLGLDEIIFQPGILLFTFHFLESMYSIYSVFQYLYLNLPHPIF